ncbi:MAG: permease prefix domain 1-containing protein [Verrucomicrobiota bacterium]
MPLDELESHLRDEIEQQVKSGLSEAEAFKTAIQKIGRAHLVQHEFKKVESRWEGLEWKLTEILLVVGPVLASLGMGRSVLLNRGMTPGQKMSCLAAFATFTLLVWGGRLGYRVFPVIRARRMRNAIGISTFVLLLVLFLVVLQRHDYTVGQLPVAVVWGWVTPMGAWAGLYCGIETAARKKLALPGL